MDCLIPLAPPSQTQPISADDLNTDNYRTIDFRKERFKPESPPVALTQRAFYVHAVTNFEWTTLCAHRASACRVISSAVACSLFTLRTFDLGPTAPAPPAAVASGRSLLTPLADQRRQSVSPVAVANTAPPGRCGSSDLSGTPRPLCAMTPLDLARRIVSRAIELECAKRSTGFGVRLQPVNCWFAEEAKPLPTTLLAADVEPADFGIASSAPAGHCCILRLQQASAADVNELSWLLGTIDDPEGATAFTRYFERRWPAQIFLELEESIVAHPFRLNSPWRTAWKWLSKPSLIAYARQAYLEAVAMTWAPVPESVEGTWIYTLMIGDADTAAARSAAEPRVAHIDAAEEVSLNIKKQAEDFALDQRRRGFTTFLWDVVAFWRGFYALLEHDIAHWIPANEDLSVIGTAILRYRLGRSISLRLPISDVVLNAWTKIGHSRLKFFHDSGTVPSSLVLVIPPKLRTLGYKLNEAQKKDRILFYGYQLIPSESGKRNCFTFGISSGGILSGAALSELKEHQPLLLEVSEDFSCNVAYLGLIFEALLGTSITVEYDEVYARFFLMAPAVNALPDEARRVFYRSPTTKRYRLKFSRGLRTGPDGDLENVSPSRHSTLTSRVGVNNPTGSGGAVESNHGLFKMLNDLSTEGGLLLLRMVEGSSTEYFLHTDPGTGPFVGGNTPSPRPKSTKKVPTLIGRLREINLSPGIYKIKDMVNLIDYVAAPYERLRIAFLEKFTDPNEEIEIFDVDDAPETQMSDLHCHQFETGETIKHIRLGED